MAPRNKSVIRVINCGDLINSNKQWHENIEKWKF